MENILNQNLTFSVGTVILVIIILLLANAFLELLMRFFFYERRKLNDELKFVEQQKENLNSIIENRVREEVKKYLLESKIHKMGDILHAIESLRRNTPEYSHQTKYFKEVNPNLLDLDMDEFSDMVAHIVGLLKYHRSFYNEHMVTKTNSVEKNKTPLQDMKGLPTRAFNSLRCNDILTVEELVEIYKWDRKRLYDFQNLGEQTIKEIGELLVKNNLI